MKFNYYPETDSLYIDLSDKKSADSVEVSNGVVIDYDDKGNITGIDIDNASKIIDINNIEAISLPINNFTLKKAS